MNRLWIRLSLAFGVVVIISALAVLATSLLFSQASGIPILRLNSLEAPDGILAVLTNYYKAHESWAGVDALFLGAESAMRPRDRFHFVLRNAEGNPLYESKGDSGKVLTSLTIEVNSAAVGSLDVSLPTRQDQPDNQSFFLRQAGDLMLSLAAVGGFGGLIFGIVVSRWLSRPLDRLATAARAFGPRQPYPRLKVSGTREIADVTQAFNEMVDVIEVAETQRRHMVADIAHELRTPLSIMRGNLLAILDGVYPLEQAEIATLYEQTNLLSRLVEDLHELSLADANQLTLHKQSVEVSNWLDGVVSAFRPVAEAESILLNMDCEADLPKVSMDAGRMTQVMDNLLSNAIRHTPSEGIITVTAACREKMLALTVKDTGSGIPPEHVPFVFDRFYRADPGRNRMMGGSGLGLAIVRAMVHTHGGEVIVESAGIVGQGTAFTVKLPIG